MNTKKSSIIKIVSVIVAILAVGGAAFYGGTQYANAQKPARGAAGSFAAGAAGARAGGMAGAMRGAGQGGNFRQMGANGGFTAGDIISNDGKSITIKLRDGGSKIVFLGDKTEVTKSAQGTAADLTVGTSVTVTGDANQDGSVNAQMVQIRPAGMPMPGAMPAQGQGQPTAPAQK